MDEVQELAALRRMQQLENKAKGIPEPSQWDALKNIGTAAYKGLAGVATGAADALAGSHDITDIGSVFAGKPVREVDTSMPVSRALEATGYQPKTTGERMVNSTVRGATGALVGGMAAPVKAAITGGLAGLSGEVAGSLPGVQGTKMEPIARVAGALAGGVGGGMATSTIGNSKALAAEMLKGTKVDDVDEARRVMSQARMAGMPVNLDQAMGKDTNITNVVKALVGQKEGQPVVDQLRAQPKQAKTLVARIVNSLPGKVREEVDLSNLSQSAATDALKKVREYRTNKTAPLFGQAGNVPDDLLDDMIAKVRAEVKANPDTNKGNLLAQLEDTLKKAKVRTKGDTSLVLDAAGNPIQGATKPVTMQELNASFRSLTNNSKNTNALNVSAGDKEAVGGLQKMVTDLRADMGTRSPKFKEANDLYASISTTKVDPLKKSVVGRVAGMTGEVADREAVGKILPVLAKGRDPNAKTSDIIRFAEETADRPEVFQDAVKTHFSNAVAKASKQLDGVDSPELPKLLEQAILGDAFKRQGMKDQLTAIAKIQGAKDPTALYRGFTHAMKIMSAAAKRPGSLGVSPGELEQIASKSLMASGAKMIGLAPGKPLGRGLEGLYSANAYKTLAENLTTPEGVAKLQELARLPLMGNKAQATLSTLLATQSAPKPPGVKNVSPGDSSDEGEDK